ncbi:hypothetical protein ABE61_12540 [Lysinibacillus sphaericus]|uniref:S-layer homology domain-containing protein n=1 Tax=Lysinibacillus sphaericus TaxID=1421 RepID=UPI0018CEF4EB|nr:S-layer homology domain-containing protein [Lysinibacillus sphaericus]MBG9454844.1 hypothetical protein [Lysinibacillus sphaericus]MBG9478272.1 hypothetical protein [Lysinibacillus sphaericus]MBG9590985.1 hypothetical protein [Lysinibacillus sphaericus]
MDFYKKWLNIAIIFILSFSLLSPAALADTQQVETSDLATSDLESSSTINNQVNDEEAKFTLGQGYIQEPVRVSFYEGENVDSNFYLSSVLDPNPGAEETNKDNKDGSVAEITIENGSNKAMITSETIQKSLEKNIKNFVIQSEKNFKIEVPTSIFKGINLAEKDQVIVSVTKDDKNKQFTVTFEIEDTNGKSKSISIDKEYLKVTLPAANKLKANTVVLQLDVGEYKPVPHKIVKGEIVLFTKTSGTFVLKESTVTYKDIEDSVYKEEIEFLASRHVIQGTTSEAFEADISITRAQFAAFVSRALGLQAIGENPFDDTKGKWYATEIQALYEAGITKGSTASTFNPEKPITRQQAAAMMARILEYVNADVKADEEINFKDANNISSEYLPYIKLLNSLDIMTGMQDGSFEPTISITRGQTAKILKRTLTIAGIM